MSGQSPIVDVQTTAQHKVVSGDLLYSLPLTKEMGGFAKVTVGATIRATAQDVGGNIDPMNGYTIIHGGHYTDNRALLDGMQFNGEGNGRGFYFNPAAASEVSVQLGGQTAEFENGGAQANLAPKDGGNHFSGMFSFNYAGKGLLSNNLTPELCYSLRNFQANLREEMSISQASMQSLRQQLHMLLWLDEWEPLNPARCWSECIRRDLRSFDGEHRVK